VGTRTREIGVRMALGAPDARVVGLVVRQGMTMSLAGVVFGTVAALSLAGLLQGLLYGVAARDPVTFIAVPTAFVAVAFAACWIPAARAARVRPAAALRAE
jgi:putative ABC transport system permease protein